MTKSVARKALLFKCLLHKGREEEEVPLHPPPIVETEEERIEEERFLEEGNSEEFWWFCWCFLSAEHIPPTPLLPERF